MNASNRSCSTANEAEMDEEMLLSDQDSESLLQDLPAFQSRASAEDTAGTDSDAQEITNKLEPNQQKRQKLDTCIGKKSAAGCAASSSRSAKAPKEKALHKRNEKGETLLHKACQKNDLAQVRMLLQAGISINIEDYAGWTALHEACVAGDESVVEELLRVGANINARSCDGVTPLHDAVCAGHYQVVMLLLENGSNPTDQNVGGESALDMAKDRNMRELLMTFQTSSEGQGKSYKGAAQCEEPGPEGGTVSDVHPRESGDAGRDVQLRQNAMTNNSFTVQRCSEAVSAVLEDVGRKQAEMSTWPLTNLKDVGRYKEAFLQTQSVLMAVLAKQRLEKNNLTHRFRVVSHHLHQRVLKGQFFSLASSQRHLVKLLQKQMELEEACIKVKTNISSQSLDHQGSIKRLKDGDSLAQAPSCHRDMVQSERYIPVSLISLLESKKKRESTFPDLWSEKASSCRKAPQTRAALQLNSKMKRKNALIQRGAKDYSGGLWQLVHGGVLPKGSELQLTIKGKQHVARVLPDGFIISKGKSYQAPERWLESILGNNIPVSSTYALDKVTFRNKPLSYYLLILEAKQKPSEIRVQDRCNKDDSTQQEPSPAPVDPYQLLRKIRIIHLVNSEELLPNAVMDLYWNKLLKQDNVDFDDWEREL